MEGNENPWPDQKKSVEMFQLVHVGVPAGATDRVGWNAIPFALEDFDSNWTDKTS